MTLDEFTIKFLQFVEESIEIKKDDGYPVCPYARSARMKQTLQFIDARNDLTTLESFDPVAFQMGICWLGDVDDIAPIEKVCEELSVKNDNLLYFTSTRTSGHFVKNFTDCVFVQRKDDLMEKRTHLKDNTTYYSSWPIDYYKLITGQTHS